MSIAWFICTMCAGAMPSRWLPRTLCHLGCCCRWHQFPTGSNMEAQTWNGCRHPPVCWRLLATETKMTNASLMTRRTLTIYCAGAWRKSTRGPDLALQMCCLTLGPSVKSPPDLGIQARRGKHPAHGRLARLALPGLCRSCHFQHHEPAVIARQTGSPHAAGARRQGPGVQAAGAAGARGAAARRRRRRRDPPRHPQHHAGQRHPGGPPTGARCDLFYIVIFSTFSTSEPANPGPDISALPAVGRRNELRPMRTQLCFVTLAKRKPACPCAVKVRPICADLFIDLCRASRTLSSSSGTRSW